MTESSTSDQTLVSPTERQYGSYRAYRDTRLKPTREDSKTYTSFPVPAGSKFEHDGYARLLCKAKASFAAPWRESGTPMDQREYPFFSRLFGSKSSNDREGYRDLYDEDGGQSDRLPGLPKVSRECLVAEIKCYGKYILPTVLVFVVLVLVIALSLFYHYNH